jgi:hypothetical protein
MRPKSTTLDLPSSHDVKICIHNEFVKHMAQLKADITVSHIWFLRERYSPRNTQAAPGKVSITTDVWSADTTKMGFMGMTAHWIEVKEKRWKIRAEVIGFKALSGNHSGENLGKYVVGLLDRVGVMDKDRSKVITITYLVVHDY